MKESFTISSQVTIREALRVIDSNRHGIVLVLNEAQQVVATATDGDIRRHLLEGLTLKDRIECCAEHNFTGVQLERLGKNYSNC